MNISVAIATYNGARYLRAQLDSLASQTLLAKELVVSDDGSTDGTRGLLDEFASSAPFPVKIYDQKVRLGFADNFLTAAGLCNSELIAFCDQDDIWSPYKLAYAFTSLSRSGAALFVHQSRIVGSALEPISILDQRLPRKGVFAPLRLDSYDRGYGHCMVFRKELLNIGSINERPLQPRGAQKIAHDHWIMQLASLFSGISISAKVLTDYRQHQTNVFGPHLKGKQAIADYSRPALADYRTELDFYESLRNYLTTEVAQAAATKLGGYVTGEQVRREITLRIARLSSRIEAYSLSSLSDRAAAFRKSVLAGSSASSVGLKTLILSGVKDAVFGVLTQRSTSR